MFNIVPKRTRFFLAFPRNARRQTSWPRERRGRLAVAARTALHSRTRTTRRHRRLSAPRRSHHLHRTRAAICAPWRVPRGSDTRAASSSLPSFLCARWRWSSACSPWIHRQASRPRAVYSSTNRRRVSRTTRPAAVPAPRSRALEPRGARADVQAHARHHHLSLLPLQPLLQRTLHRRYCLSLLPLVTGCHHHLPLLPLQSF